MIIFNKFIETLDKLVDTNSTLANTVHKRIDKMDNKMDLIYEEIKKSNEQRGDYILPIQRKISPYNHYDNANKPAYIVLHYTGNDTDTAKNNADYFFGGNRGTSAHYFVDDNSIWQSVEDYDGAWAVGDGGGKYSITNTNSISVEMCCVNGVVTDKTESNALDLVKHLQKKYNISNNNVVRHYDASRKICPNWSANNWARWNNFKNKLNVVEEVNYSMYVFSKNQ